MMVKRWQKAWALILQLELKLVDLLSVLVGYGF